MSTTRPPPTRTGPTFAGDVAAMLLGHGGRAGLQGLYFVILAAALSADGFGAFSAVLAVVGLAMPFATLGAVHLMIRAVVRDRASAPREFATATCVTAVGGALATTVVTAAAALVLDARVPVAALACLAAADLVGNLLAEVCAALFSATGRMRAAAAVQLSFSALRLLGALALLLAPAAFTLTSWAPVYAATSLLAAAALVVVVRRDVGPARPAPLAHLRQWRDGVQFSIGLGAQAVYNDIDKAMLFRISGDGAAGVYSAAYRVVDMALVPLRALLAAAYPRFFASGAGGLAGALALTRRLLPAGLGYAALASAALLLGAPLLPVVLGESYAGSVDALRGLAVLPVLKVAHHLAADALTGAGHQGVRSAWQVGVAGVNVGLNLALVPVWGVEGAVVSSIACDALLALALWAVVLRRVPHSRRGGHPSR